MISNIKQSHSNNSTTSFIFLPSQTKQNPHQSCHGKVSNTFLFNHGGFRSSRNLVNVTMLFGYHCGISTNEQVFAKLPSQDCGVRAWSVQWNFQRYNSEPQLLSQTQVHGKTMPWWAGHILDFSPFIQRQEGPNLGFF